MPFIPHTEDEVAAMLATIGADRIDDDFVRACEFMLACSGRIVVTGMGKSGHIANKIAAILASTGSPAFFVHPGEASHGDLGMITASDVVIALSNSGETGEITAILPLIKRMGVPLISMTGNPDSPLATEAEVNLDVSVTQEACPLGGARAALEEDLAEADDGLQRVAHRVGHAGLTGPVGLAGLREWCGGDRPGDGPGAGGAGARTARPGAGADGKARRPHPVPAAGARPGPGALAAFAGGLGRSAGGAARGTPGALVVGCGSAGDVLKLSQNRGSGSAVSLSAFALPLS